jgi:ankyrin repeat protein
MPLIWAAKGGHDAIVKQPIERRDIVLSLNMRDVGGRAAPLWAALEGHDAVVKQLIKSSDIDINLIDSHRQTAFLLAAANGREGVVKLFLDRNLDTSQVRCVFIRSDTIRYNTPSNTDHVALLNPPSLFIT